MPTEAECDARALAKGLRYRVTLEDNGVVLTPLYLRSPDQAALVMRELYPKARMLDVKVLGD